MNLSQRSEAAFSSTVEPTFADTYLGEVRNNWRDTEKDLRRSVTVVFLLATAFELMSRGRISEASLGIVKLTKTDLVQEALPVVIAYLAFAIVNLAVQSAALRAVHDAVLKVSHPKAFEHDFEHFLVPGNAAFYSQQPTRALLGETSAHKSLSFVVGAARVTTITVFPFIFVIYAYVRLFETQRVGIVASIGLAVSAFFAVVSVLLLFKVRRESDFNA